MTDEPEAVTKSARHGWREKVGMWCAAAVIVTGGVVAYSNSFAGTYIDVDDQMSIVNNPHIRSLRNPWAAMTLPPYELPVGATPSGRPLVGLSLALTYALSGTAPWGYHLFNLVIHCIAGIAAYGIVRRTLLYGRGMGWNERVATVAGMAVGLVWIVHPLNTQAVTYMVQRAECQMGMFYLLTMYSAVRRMQGGSRWRSAGAVALCIMGMLTKQVMVTAPLVIYLYDVVFASGTWKGAWRERRWLHVMLWATIGLQIPLHLMIADDIRDDFNTASPLALAAINPRVILHYLRLSVWPHPLCFSHAWPHRHWWWDYGGPWLVVTAAVVWGAWGVWRKWWWGWLVAWFFIILAPTTSIYPMKHAVTVCEHRMYLPLLAVVTAGVLGCAWLVRRHGSAVWRWAGWGGLLLVVTIYAGMTRGRNAVYHEYEHFVQDTLCKQPEHWRMRYSYAGYLREAGRFSEALREYSAIMTYITNVPQVYLARGHVLMQLGRYEEALADYEVGARMGYHADVFYLYAAEAIARLGDINRAIEYGCAAVAHQPSNAAAHARLSAWYEAAGECERSVAHAAEAAKLLRVAHRAAGVGP